MKIISSIWKQVDKLSFLFLITIAFSQNSNGKHESILEFREDVNILYAERYSKDNIQSYLEIFEKVYNTIISDKFYDFFEEDFRKVTNLEELQNFFAYQIFSANTLQQVFFTPKVRENIDEDKLLLVYESIIAGFSPRLMTQLINDTFEEDEVITIFQFLDSYKLSTLEATSLTEFYLLFLAEFWKNIDLFHLNGDFSIRQSSLLESIFEIIIKDIEFIYDYHLTLNQDSLENQISKIDYLSLYENFNILTFKNHFISRNLALIDKLIIFNRSDLQISNAKLGNIYLFYVQLAKSTNEKFSTFNNNFLNDFLMSASYLDENEKNQIISFSNTQVNQAQLELELITSIDKLGIGNFDYSFRKEIIDIWNNLAIDLLIRSNYNELALLSVIKIYPQFLIGSLLSYYTNDYPSSSFKKPSSNIVEKVINQNFEKMNSINVEVFNAYYHDSPEIERMLNDTAQGLDFDVENYSFDGLRNIMFMNNINGEEFLRMLIDDDYYLSSSSSNAYAEYLSNNLNTLDELSDLVSKLKYDQTDNNEIKKILSQAIEDNIRQNFNILFGDIENNVLGYFDSLSILKFYLLYLNDGNIFGLDLSDNSKEVIFNMNYLNNENLDQYNYTADINDDEEIFELWLLELIFLQRFSFPQLYRFDNVLTSLANADKELSDQIQLIKGIKELFKFTGVENIIIYNTSVANQYNTLFMPSYVSYIITFNNDSIQITKKINLNKDGESIAGDIRVLNSLIIDDNPQMAYYLKNFYKKLIPVEYLDYDLVNFHFIKDPIFYNISFESLLNDNDRYLIQDHYVSNYLSLAQLYHTVGKYFQNFNVLKNNLIFFGNVDYQNTKFDHLPNLASEHLFFKEMEKDSTFTMKSFEREDASLKNLKNYNSGDFLYLSLHSSANQENFYDSEIYFHDESLTIKNVHNIDLRYDLVYLSACETDYATFNYNLLPNTFSKYLNNNRFKNVVSTKFKIEDRFAMYSGSLFVLYYFSDEISTIGKTSHDLINFLIDESEEFSSLKYWSNLSFFGY